jgi:cobalt-zinc-cadmium efflux system outer membrane protein
MKHFLIAATALAACSLIGPHGAAAQESSQSTAMPQMPGMNLTPPSSLEVPIDMQANGQQGSNAPAAKATRSIENSEQQQQTQHGVKPGPRKDAASPTHPTMVLQEPENPNYHTGQSLPAPELLNEVAKRRPMSVENFVRMAEHKNPTLAEARSDVRRSEQQGRQAALYPNPSIAYDGEHIRGGEYGAGEQGAYVQQEIVLGGKLRLRREIYQQQAKVNEIGVDEQTYRVRDTVQQAFYRALTAQYLVVVRQRLLKVAEDAVETAHQLGNVGQADAPDILQAEVEAEQEKVNFVRAQREYLQDFQTLAAAAGDGEMEAAPLQGDLEELPQLDVKQQVAAIVATSPEVKRAQQEVSVAEARLKDAGREPIPNLTLRAGEWWSGEIIASSGKAAGPMSFAMAGIDLPLWNRNQGNREAARAELERCREDVERIQLSLRQQAEPYAQQYQAAIFEADRYRTELLPRARRAYELYLMKYQQMAAAYPEVLVSQRTLFQLQTDYLHALDEVWANALALQNYMLMHGLDQPAASGTESTTINLPNGGGSE